MFLRVADEFASVCLFKNFMPLYLSHYSTEFHFYINLHVSTFSTIGLLDCLKKYLEFKKKIEK